VSAVAGPLPRAPGARRAAKPRPAAAGAATRDGLRALVFTALALFAAVHWAWLLEPDATGRMATAALVALAAGVVVRLAATLPRGVRLLAGAAALLVGAVAVLSAAGVGGELLRPRAWGALTTGLGQGLEALPSLTVPYRGVDPWVRIVIPAGGGLLLVLAAALAAHAARRGTRPVAAAVVLSVVYAVPVTQHSPDQPFLDGALFSVFLGALLWADRVQRPSLPGAGAFVVLAAVAGLLVAPRLDGNAPLLDYQHLAESLTTPPSTGFSWSHGYGPLDWPRDGRELLRVSAESGAYWKAADLDTFDGVRWRVGGVAARGVDSEISRRHRDWRQRLRVSVTGLRSSQFVGAGVAFAVTDAPGGPVPSTPGTFTTTTRELRRGDSYAVEAYTPRPTPRELEDAGTAYPGFARAYLSMALPEVAGGPPIVRSDGVPSAVRLGPAQIAFAPFGSDEPVQAILPSGELADGAGLLSASAYRETYALAQRLRAGSPTPYAFARAIEAALSDGFRYTEHPEVHRLALPAFLFADKAGYCQHFSGAMALLLRMGGVPARVSSGFSPGTFDGDREEWVVRDRDAHSWVEAYFPGYGWATFDPTPQEAPARGQLAAAGTPAAANAVPLTAGSSAADVPARQAPAAAPGAGAGGAGGGGAPAWLVAVLAAGVLGVTGLLLARRRAQRRGPRRPGVAPELAELERALRRSGRPPEPALTLRSLEARFARTAPQAAGYVAAVRAARFAGAGGGPTRAQRAALRRELAQGLGLLGRLRAWWALPPGGYLH
jgi:transglutaminase-like putative cysteine protease